MIENVDSTEKEIIEFDKIENVVFSKENQKEFSISYSTNPEQNDIKLSKFSRIIILLKKIFFKGLILGRKSKGFECLTTAAMSEE